MSNDVAGPFESLGALAAIGFGSLAWIGVAVWSLMVASLAAAMFVTNLRLFQYIAFEPRASTTDASVPSVSILIPARNEAAGIGDSIAAALTSLDTIVEVVVLDDGSTDGTGDIVRSMMATDDRIRLIDGIPLPAGWNGKQHACYRLADAAQYDLLLFLDADVRLKPMAVATLAGKYQRGVGEFQFGLLSAFPFQETGTWMEKLLIPMMHQILLCYLPFTRMRASTHPSYASGCGQLFLTRRDDYQAAGTHQAIALSRHDGVKLPKAFRDNGMITDCIDGTDLATCRMYRSGRQVIQGLLKNANEGIANAKLIGPFTVLLLSSFVVPWLIAPLAAAGWIRSGGQWSAGLAAAVIGGIAIAIGWIPRWMGVTRLRQSTWGAIFHPFAVSMFVAIQWWAFLNQLTGRTVAWRGRKET
ncbi:MAG: glycosyltransferase family 2 protein [Planctomycetota bacterium]